MRDTPSKVGFSGKRVRQVRELLGMTQTELALKVGVSQGAIGQIEGAFKDASAELIKRIADQTEKFEVGFFYHDPPVELSPDSVIFRAKASMRRTEEAEARRYTEVLYELSARLLRHIRPMQFRFLHVASKGPVEAARQTRSILGLPVNEPIDHLLREIEKSGVLVLALPKELQGRDALSVGIDCLNTPIIALSRNRPGDRIRLSAAHELGHLVLKHSRRLHAAEEREAFEYGAELLMPEAAMRREMTAPVTLAALAKLKSRWRVSLQALIHRGQDLRIITDSQAADLYIQLSAKGWRTKEPGVIPQEKPRLVRQLIERVYGGNLGELADELGFRREFLAEILEGFADLAAAGSPQTKAISMKRS